jgi:hypothetical protein
VVRVTVLPLAALALGVTPTAIATIGSTVVVSAALALGVAPAPTVKVTVLPMAALALGSTPAATPVITSPVTVVVSAALAIGSAPAPSVLVARTVTAAVAAGSSPTPSVRVASLVAAALALATTVDPQTLGGRIPGIVTVTDGGGATVSLTDIALVSLVLRETTAELLVIRDFSDGLVTPQMTEPDLETDDLQPTVVLGEPSVGSVLVRDGV